MIYFPRSDQSTRTPIRMTILILFVWSSVLFAEKMLTLGESAQNIAKDMPRGCIVTGEWRNGEVVYSITGPDQPSSVPPEKVVFEIGSISKTFTGLLLAQAVVEKRLTLDTTLKQALGKKQLFTDDKVATITLAQLATHTSGLPRMPDNSDFSVPDPYNFYNTQMLLDWIGFVELKKAGPHEESYSNVGIALLGHVIEKALGDTWANLVRERICEPLGMHDTRPIPTPEMRQRLVPPFKGRENAHHWTFQTFAPAGGLHSTAADLMAFGHALTHPETSPIRKAIQLAVKPLAENVGYCFFLGEDVIMHNGKTDGYSTLLEARPKADQVRVVLINNSEIEPINVTRPLDRKQFSAVEGPKLGEAELRSYTGAFKLNKEAKFIFIIREGGLWGKLTGQSFIPYLHEKEDVFFHRGAVARVIFGRDASGTVTQVTLDQNNQKKIASRLDEKVPNYIFRPAKELEDFTGVYDYLPPDKIITIISKGETLFAQITGQSFFPVFETKPGVFEYDVVLASIEFERNEDGIIKSLHLNQNGQRLPALKRMR